MRFPTLSATLSKVALCLICVTLLATERGLVGETPYWPMVGYDAAHTNWNRLESDLYPPFPVEIVDSVGLGIGGLSTRDGILYVAYSGGIDYVSAVEISTGDILWTFSIPNSTGNGNVTPALLDTLVYVGGQQGTHIHCLDTRTGTEIWSYPTGSLYSRPATVDEGMVYVNTSDSLICLDGITGSLLWARGSAARLTPAIQGGALYVPLQSDSVIALDKTSGDLIWAVETPVDNWSPILAGDSLLYFGSDSAHVKALRFADGSERWSRTFPGGDDISDLSTGAFAFAYNLLYVSIWSDSAGNGKVYALDGDDGAPVWEAPLDAVGAFAPVVANSVVYVSDWWGGTLYALDALTGNRITTFANLSQDYIVSDGSLIALRFGTPELHILRMEPLSVGDGRKTGSPLPRVVSLDQNRPNPFNPSTELYYRLADEQSQVRLSIYDVRGRHVRTLVDRTEAAGEHVVRWNGTNEKGGSLPSGIYLYRLEVKGLSPSEVTTQTRKMLLLK